MKYIHASILLFSALFSSIHGSDLNSNNNYGTYAITGAACYTLSKDSYNRKNHYNVQLLGNDAKTEIRTIYDCKESDIKKYRDSKTKTKIKHYIYAQDLDKIWFFTFNDQLISETGYVSNIKPPVFFESDVDRFAISYMGNADLSKASKIDLKTLALLFDLTQLKSGLSKKNNAFLCCCTFEKSFYYLKDNMKERLIKLGLHEEKKES